MTSLRQNCEVPPDGRRLRSRIWKVLRWIWGWGRSLAPPHQATPERLVPILVQDLVTLGMKHDANILDVGGRDASYRKYIQRFEGQYICLDIHQGGEGRVDVFGDAHMLPFRDESIDLIICFEVLEHLQEPWVVLETFYRVLQPNGFLILTTPQYWHIHGWPNDYFRYTKEGLSFLSRKAGFVIERMIPMGGPGMLLTFICYNNMGLDRDPFRRCFLGLPIGWVGYIADATIFRRNLTGPNPDTRGWAMIARKPTVDSNSRTKSI